MLRELQVALVPRGPITFRVAARASCPGEIAGDGQKGEADQPDDDAALPRAALPVRQGVLARQRCMYRPVAAALFNQNHGGAIALRRLARAQDAMVFSPDACAWVL